MVINIIIIIISIKTGSSSLFFFFSAIFLSSAAPLPLLTARSVTGASGQQAPGPAGSLYRRCCFAAAFFRVVSQVSCCWAPTGRCQQLPGNSTITPPLQLQPYSYFQLFFFFYYLAAGAQGQAATTGIPARLQPAHQASRPNRLFCCSVEPAGSCQHRRRCWRAAAAFT